MDDPELKLEQPELGRSAGLRIADPEEAPTYIARPARKTERAVDHTAQPHNEE